MNKLNYFTRLLSFLILSLTAVNSYSQTVQKVTNPVHEITIFAIPEVKNIKWENPSILLKSTANCYISAIFQKNYYVIGHIITRISSPLLDSTIYVGMNGADQTEKVKSVLKGNVGLGIFGLTMKGRMEPYKHIQEGISIYAKRDKVVYLKFRVNEDAINRVHKFLDYYKTKNEFGFAPCEKYNGALWPRYENEGSGCSAFGMTILDVAGILPEFAWKDWMVNVDVPMELIGGEFNGNKKIKLGSILKTKSWYNGNGNVNVDFVNYSVFDPGRIFKWINDKRLQNDSVYKTESENKINGLFIDKSNSKIDENEPVLVQRKDTALFVKSYYKKFKK